jgi:cytochrome P450 family 135
MQTPRTTPAEPGESQAPEAAGTAPSAARCPVDHAANGSTSLEQAVPRPPAVIPAATLPGPRMPILLQMITYWRRPVEFVERCRDRYGSRFALRLRKRPLYVLTDPEDVRQMFLAPADVLHTGNGSVVLEKLFGQTGLAWLDEDEHKTRRKYIMQCVHGTALQRIETSINEMARKDIANWPQGETISLHPLIYRLTLDVICEVIFGPVRPACWEELRGLLMQLIEFNYKIVASVMIHKMSPRKVRLLTAIRPLGLHNFLKVRERMDELIAEAVAERRAAGGLGDDMLSILLGITQDDGSELSAVDLRNEIMTMMGAGTETTAAALSWAFEFLSREQTVRDRLVAEIDKAEDDAYISATIQEVLRVRPPIPVIIIREAMKPIEIGGVRYEPRTLMMASSYMVHRNTTLYPDPEAFRPERFLGAKPGIHTWIPYGGGRIRCLGAPVAELEMKAVIREVMGRFELHRVNRRQEKIRLHLAVVVPGKGARLELRPRQGISQK